MAKLKEKKVAVHSMYLDRSAKSEFTFISNVTGGSATELNVNSSDAAEKLTGVISTAILKNVGGDADGDKLVTQYKQRYGGFS